MVLSLGSAGCGSTGTRVYACRCIRGCQLDASLILSDVMRWRIVGDSWRASRVRRPLDTQQGARNILVCRRGGHMQTLVASSKSHDVRRGASEIARCAAGVGIAACAGGASVVGSGGVWTYG